MNEPTAEDVRLADSALSALEKALVSSDPRVRGAGAQRFFETITELRTSSPGLWQLVMTCEHPASAGYVAQLMTGKERTSPQEKGSALQLLRDLAFYSTMGRDNLSALTHSSSGGRQAGHLTIVDR